MANYTALQRQKAVTTYLVQNLTFCTIEIIFLIIIIIIPLIVYFGEKAAWKMHKSYNRHKNQTVLTALQLVSS